MNIQDSLISILKKHKPDINEEKLSMDTPLSELGIDSLDFIEVVFDIETVLGAEVPNEKLGQLKTLGDFVSCIES